MFINPIELLDVMSNDADKIKKAKKRLLREIDLEDGMYEYRGEEITKSQVEQAIDSLEGNFDAYLYIRCLPGLNKFLSTGDNGDEGLFFGLKDYQGPDAHDFEVEALISKTFAEQVGRYLKKYPTATNIGNAEIYLDMWVSPVDKPTAYAPLLDKYKSLVEDVDDAASLIAIRNLPLPNKEIADNLPSYFDSALTDLAWAIRNRTVDFVNKDQESFANRAKGGSMGPHALNAAGKTSLKYINTGIELLQRVIGWKVQQGDKLSEDLKQLTGLKKQISDAMRMLELRTISNTMSQNYRPTTYQSQDNSGCGWIIAVAIILFIIIAANS